MMELNEAKRRFEKLLVIEGYKMSGTWASPREGIHSMALKELPSCRALLWRDGSRWAAMISVRVGESGEMPISGGFLNANRTTWAPKPYYFVSDRIEQIIKIAYLWSLPRVDDPSKRIQECLVELAIHALRLKQTNKAKGYLLSIRKGEFEGLGPAEALELTQSKWARNRKDLLEISLVWLRVFEPRLFSSES